MQLSEPGNWNLEKALDFKLIQKRENHTAQNHFLRSKAIEYRLHVLNANHGTKLPCFGLPVPTIKTAKTNRHYTN